MKYYLAYGSNLNVEQMKKRCPEAEIVGTAVIENSELVFKGSLTGSYLTIEKRTGAKTPVGVWKVNAKDERALDFYEGYPRFYYKKEMTVKMNNGKKVAAFAYIMRENRPYGIPSESYVGTCLAGYRSFGFDEKYLAEAYRISKGRVFDEKQQQRT